MYWSIILTAKSEIWFVKCHLSLNIASKCGRLTLRCLKYSWCISDTVYFSQWLVYTTSILQTPTLVAFSNVHTDRQHVCGMCDGINVHWWKLWSPCEYKTRLETVDLCLIDMICFLGDIYIVFTSWDVYRKILSNSKGPKYALLYVDEIIFYYYHIHPICLSLWAKACNSAKVL